MSVEISGELAPPTFNRLPAGYYDKMAALMWNVGLAILGTYVQSPPMVPARLRSYPILLNDYGLEMAFTFRRNEVTDLPEATTYHAILSEVEQHRTEEDTVIWSWRSFELDMLRRRRTYESGLSVMKDGVEVELLDSTPRLQQSTGIDTPVWHAARLTSKDFTVHDVHTFVKGLETYRDFYRSQT